MRGHQYFTCRLYSTGVHLIDTAVCGMAHQSVGENGSVELTHMSMSCQYLGTRGGVGRAEAARCGNGGKGTGELCQ